MSLEKRLARLERGQRERRRAEEKAADGYDRARFREWLASMSWEHIDELEEHLKRSIKEGQTPENMALYTDFIRRLQEQGIKY